MKFELGKGTAVVTGAASGIGAALAVELAARGASLALIDVDAEGAERTAQAVRDKGGTVSVHPADLGKPAEIDDAVAAVRARHPAIHCLVNNAGVGMIGTIEQLTIEEFEWLFSINFWAGVRLTKALLPALRAASEARIANVASILGIIAAPGQAPYVASKFAMRGFSEALQCELHGSSVGVTTVFPGGVATAIAQRARRAAAIDEARARADLERYATGLVTRPEDAARQIADAIEQRRPRLLIGKDARRADLIQRLRPAHYWSIIAKRMAR